MPKGPQGQKRKADVIGNAVHIMKIATGEIEESPENKGKAEGGKKGGAKRAASLTPERRREIAKDGAKKRWDKT